MRILQIIFFSCSFMILSCLGIVQAQETSDNARQLQDAKAKLEDAKAKIQGMRKNSLEQQKQLMKEMEKQNPELYKKEKAKWERESQIDEILAQYEEKKISADMADTRLRPLIEEQIREENASKLVDNRIALTKEQLKELEEIKYNPGQAVRNRIDQLLGRSTSAAASNFAPLRDKLKAVQESGQMQK